MKYRNGFKDYEEVKNCDEWGKMYYCFDDLERYDSAFMLNYLIDTEPVTKHNCLDEGYEDYIRYADSYIEERLTGVTKHIINSMLADLEKHGYIFIHHNGNKSKGMRYIKLNYEKLAKSMGIGVLNTVSNSVSSTVSNGVSNTVSKNLIQNIITDKQTNTVTDKHIRYY